MAAPLPNLSLHDGVKANELDAPKIVNEWLSKFEKHFQDRSLSDASGLFLEDCWWRDIIALSWDWATKHGQESVFKYLKASSTGFRQLESVKSGGLQPAFVDMGGLQWIQSGFNFKTSAGHGTGLVRLANVGPSDWRAWTVLTELEQLNGQEELERQKNDKTLTDARFYEAHNGDPTPISEDLQVLIVGAGRFMQPFVMCRC